ncbi:hypothetical protein E0H68_06200 [Rhizobium leguminosarum bv. viciae]|uniref:hypothetical protein n=1 Tax=Rhizobium leguminosarum TaxID=384 RepID=UPI00103BB621|nr:hypothetical protein [Rhizobium leguminosarum]TCA17365.1 hypothetical protein E0H68_06200 [Rhizobium leguminosarum bv. viciae]
MNPVVRKIFDRGSGHPIVDLSGETLADLLSAIDELSDEAIASDLFHAMWTSRSPDCDAAISHNIDVAEDPGLVAEIARIVTLEPRVHLPDRFTSDLLRLADRRDRHPITRAQALKAAYVLSLGRPSDMRRLQAQLLDISLDDEPLFLQHAATVIGFILAHIRDDELLMVLNNLMAVKAAESEAAMSLGLLWMAEGLGATEETAALTAFEASLQLMRRAIEATEVRIDAELFSRCLTVLLAFAKNEQGVGLGDLIDEIHRIAFQYSATAFPSDDRARSDPWMGAPALEGIRWYELSIRIAQVDQRFRSRAWLHAARVIEEELVRLYAASRSILLHTRDGGIDAIIRPRISDGLQRDRARLATLEQWLEENQEAAHSPSVAAVRGMIAEALEDSLRRHPPAAAASEDAVAEALNQLPPDLAVGAREHLRSSLVNFDLEVTDPILLQVWSDLAAGLQRNDDYRNNSGARAFFNTILYSTLSFVFSRTNLTVSAVSGIDYLFNRDKANLPIEKDLQKDFYSFLQSTALRAVAIRERNDLGGGRSDIDFVLGGASVVAELKKTDVNHDLQGLAKAFGLQTAAYQRSSYTLCVLMVLDLVDRRGDAPNVRECVGLQEVVPPGGTTMYSIVVVRIQGMRKPPHDLK